jgi:8-hydroxy-5-deazaflavin:NADPH oxidoreductase
MKIGIIGSGHIGGNFGLHLAKAGHEVMFSSRHPEQLSSLAEEAGEQAQKGTIEEAAVFGELLVLSVPFKAIESLANSIGDQARNKVIIDTCNPYPGRDGEVASKVINDPAMRQSAHTASHFPSSKIVKALNTIYYVHLKAYAFREGADKIALPIAGDDADAKKTVSQLLKDIGFEPIDVGKLADSKVMEVDQLLYNKPMSAQEMRDKLKQKP